MREKYKEMHYNNRPENLIHSPQELSVGCFLLRKTLQIGVGLLGGFPVRLF